MSSTNRVTRIAIVGASGNSGKPMTLELLKTGKHTVTALTREDSTSELPEGVKTAHINYDKPETIVNALKGQEVLIITLSVTAPPETHKILVAAAAQAGVPWILPNEYGTDTDANGVDKDVPVFQKKTENRKHIESLGKSSWIGVTCGFWYEWSLSLPFAYGLDFKNKAMTFFDDGETKISTSTWPQVGRAVAALLSLPVQPEGDNTEAFLEHCRNRPIYFNSFTITQKDMFESALRVTGTKAEDWKVTYEPSHIRHKEGVEAMKKGDRIGFAKAMYSRVFYPEGSPKNVANFEASQGLQNELLELPVEDIDTATSAAWERAKAMNL